MTPLRIAYFGSPQISADLLHGILEAKSDAFELELVVTQPDKPTGKRLALTPTPVKVLALKHNIPLFDETFDENAVIALLDKANVDMGIVFAFGEILGEKLLKSLKYGFINIHPSLLPLYRGPSPTTYPLLLGDSETGVSLIEMTSKLDSGPILSQERLPIVDNERRPDMEKRLIQKSISLTADLITQLAEGAVKSVEQDSSQATYTRLLNKNDGFIPLELLKKAFNNEVLNTGELPILIKDYYKKYRLSTSSQLLSSSVIFNYFRGLYPWPGTWTTIPTSQGEKRVKLLDMELTATHHLRLLTVQLEGKRPVDFSTFNQAYNIFA